MSVNEDLKSLFIPSFRESFPWSRNADLGPAATEVLFRGVIIRRKQEAEAWQEAVPICVNN